VSLEPSDADGDFERSLLEAARREEPPSPAETERAWRRFATSGSQVAASVVGGAARAWPSSSSLGWLATGLLAGSMATAALMAGRDAVPEPVATTGEQASAAAALSGEQGPRHAHQPLPAPVAPPPALPATVPAEGESPPAPFGARRVANRARFPASESTAEAASAPRAPKRGATPDRAAPKQRGSRGAAAAGLEAEVRALDDIQRAVSDGHALEALDAVDAFHREFPRAQLAADAEGLAIEALLARGDTDAAAERAARFLERYPSDPHAPRFAPLVREGR
jgi:hypothetical protein